MATEVGETPLRVLPYDVAIAPPRGHRQRTEAATGTLAAEWLTGAWLRGRGLDVVSVRRREGRHLKTPDAVAPSAGVTLEIKHPVATSNAIVQRVRVGRKQSRRIVIDLRRTGADRDLAEIAFGSAIRMYGDHLDEVALIVNDDLALGRAHG